MRRAILVITAGLFMLACGEQPAAKPSDPGSYRLFLRDYSSITVVDASSGQVVNRLPAGVQTPDWSRVYTGSTSQSQTLLALDPMSGQRQAEFTLPGPFQIPSPGTPLAAVSPSGRWIAVSRWDTAPGPPGVGWSHFAVVDGQQAVPVRQADLRGYWTVDALSNDGHWLYLIENLPGNGSYRVRLFDLVTGILNPAPVIDPHDGDTPMTGQRMDSVASPDGAWIYSLYATGGGAFIHALPVGSGSTRAVCIDLPDVRSADSMTLAMSPDGSRLYVTDGAAGLVKEVIPPAAGATGKVSRTLRLESRRSAFNPFMVDAAAGSGPGDATGAGVHSALTRAGVLYFPTTSGMGAVDVKAWKPVGRYLDQQRIRTLALSSDGRWLYAVTSSNSLLRIDPGSGRSLQELRSGPWSLQLERATPAH